MRTLLYAKHCLSMFLILPDQEVRLRSIAGQRLYARGLFEGIRSFLRRRALAPEAPTDVGRRGSESSPRAQSTTSSRLSGGGTSEADVAP